jgi:hypothetical protein
MIRENASTILAEDALNRKVFALRMFWGKISLYSTRRDYSKRREMDYLPPCRVGEFV